MKRLPISASEVRGSCGDCGLLEREHALEEQGSCYSISLVVETMVTTWLGLNKISTKARNLFFKNVKCWQLLWTNIRQNRESTHFGGLDAEDQQPFCGCRVRGGKRGAPPPQGAYTPVAMTDRHHKAVPQALVPGELYQQVRGPLPLLWEVREGFSGKEIYTVI